ncbi:MAG: DUF234 domain-containing protein [Campylobacteraceae bacterium]|jgi:hypothetical protein|nr:DUF234 domain-containing protein [Campylobacteraceae bacterium]
MGNPTTRDRFFCAKIIQKTKGRVIERFISFCKEHKRADIAEQIEYFALFEGFWLDFDAGSDVSALEAVERFILPNAQILSSGFTFSHHQQEFTDMLIALANGDRKIYSVYDKCTISRFLGQSLYKELFASGIIKKELSREEPLKRVRKERLKKGLGNYKIEDKVLFCDSFTRFWYTFIAPNFALIKSGEEGKLLEIIKSGFEKFVSLTFEMLCEKLLAIKLGRQIISSGSYWSKNSEIDILAIDEECRYIAAEVKWKNHAVCKNILTHLQKKCAKERLGVETFALFSKSGFSKELLKMQSEKLLLFDLKDFEEFIRRSLHSPTFPAYL